MTEEDRYCGQTECLRQKGLLTRIQEPEYRTEKIKSLVHVVQDFVTNNCSSAW
jgi:hypothetical protein